MRQVCTHLLLGILLLPLMPCLADNHRLREMVLVTAADSPVSTLTPAQLRRLYLGTPMESRGVMLIPLRNISDAYLYEVFLQKVVTMSARHYDRHLLGQTFRGNNQRLPAYDDLPTLIDTLTNTPGTVSFMRAETLKDQPGLRVIQTIWTEPNS